MKKMARPNFVEITKSFLETLQEFEPSGLSTLLKDLYFLLNKYINKAKNDGKFGGIDINFH
jgi:hypothetical protein